MADCKVLATAMGRGQDAHGNTAQDMCTDELANSLSLVTTVVHPHILKSSFLRAKRWHLRKSAAFQKTNPQRIKEYLVSDQV